MPDLNDKLSAAANSEVHRSGYQATAPEFGLNKQALGTVTGGTLPDAPQQMALQDPLELLKAQSETKEKELSLETLKPKEKEKIMDAFKRARDIAKDHYSQHVEKEVLHRRNVYEGDKQHYKKKFPRLSETSNWVSKDVKTACTWIQTQLMEAFTSSEAPLSVKGVNIEDDETASKIQELIRYQLERKNDWYSFCLTATGYALSENFCVAKVWWKREEEHTPMELMLDLNDTNAIISLMEGIGSGQIDGSTLKMTELKDTDDFLKVTYDLIKVKSNHPVVEYVPTSELRYTPDAANIHDCKFVAHRKIVRGDYLKRREIDGVYKNVDKALEKFQGDTSATILDIENDRQRHQTGKYPDDKDNASKEVELYEAYMQVDYNNDGVYENIIVHAVGDTPIRIAKNEYEFPPFFICEALHSPNEVFNKDSYTDILEQQQDLKTALMRQIITNVAKNNQPRVFVNERNVDMDALMGNEEIIPVQNGSNPGDAIMIPPQLPLSSVTMEVIQYAQNEIESQSGSTRYNQGLDSNSLNHTATGITSILGQAEKRTRMIARSIAENFFIPIYKFVIMLNQKYLEDEQMVRLLDKTFKIRKEELDIDYDLIVNVGQGAGTKEAQIQYLMLVLNQIYPQLTANGIVNAKSWYNLVCKLLEALGLRDVSQYLLDPESPEAQAAAQQQMQAQAAAQAQAFQNQLALYAAKGAIPRVDVDINKMPPDVQRQYLKDKLGIETTEKAIAEHEVLVNA